MMQGSEEHRVPNPWFGSQKTTSKDVKYERKRKREKALANFSRTGTLAEFDSLNLNQPDEPTIRSSYNPFTKGILKTRPILKGSTSNKPQSPKKRKVVFDERRLEELQQEKAREPRKCKSLEQNTPYHDKYHHLSSDDEDFLGKEATRVPRRRSSRDGKDAPPHTTHFQFNVQFNFSHTRKPLHYLLAQRRKQLTQEEGEVLKKLSRNQLLVPDDETDPTVNDDEWKEKLLKEVGAPGEGPSSSSSSWVPDGTTDDGDWCEEDFEEYHHTTHTTTTTSTTAPFSATPSGNVRFGGVVGCGGLIDKTKQQERDRRARPDSPIPPNFPSNCFSDGSDSTSSPLQATTQKQSCSFEDALLMEEDSHAPQTTKQGLVGTHCTNEGGEVERLPTNKTRVIRFNDALTPSTSSSGGAPSTPTTNSSTATTSSLFSNSNVNSNNVQHQGTLGAFHSPLQQANAPPPLMSTGLTSSPSGDDSAYSEASTPSTNATAGGCTPSPHSRNSLPHTSPQTTETNVFQFGGVATLQSPFSTTTTSFNTSSPFGGADSSPNVSGFNTNQSFPTPPSTDPNKMFQFGVCSSPGPGGVVPNSALFGPAATTSSTPSPFVFSATPVASSRCSFTTHYYSADKVK
eukprot:TRINITY_DN52592_c0_g1_i1.p1 TRINITY_DN52592_c0_g1~~TRINITY_DN52592_c0_g1_i1.p1  ORF type:complete len:637 (+),score=80.22 TRINITY_DN52592_c0_g1_i1:32-1912(+)